MSDKFINKIRVNGENYSIRPDDNYIEVKSPEYHIQTINVRPGDTIIIRVSEYIDPEDCGQIQKEMEKIYPENTVLVANELILKDIIIVRKEEPSKEDMFNSNFHLKNLLYNDPIYGFENLIDTPI